MRNYGGGWGDSQHRTLRSHLVLTHEVRYNANSTRQKTITLTLLLVCGDLKLGFPTWPIKHRFFIWVIAHAGIIISCFFYFQGSGEQAVNKRIDLYTSQYNTQWESYKDTCERMNLETYLVDNSADFLGSLWIKKSQHGQRRADPWRYRVGRDSRCHYPTHTYHFPDQLGIGAQVGGPVNASIHP